MGPSPEVDTSQCSVIASDSSPCFTGGCRGDPVRFSTRLSQSETSSSHVFVLNSSCSPKLLSVHPDTFAFCHLRNRPGPDPEKTASCSFWTLQENGMNQNGANIPQPCWLPPSSVRQTQGPILDSVEGRCSVEGKIYISHQFCKLKNFAPFGTSAGIRFWTGPWIHPRDLGLQTTVKRLAPTPRAPHMFAFARGS